QATGTAQAAPELQRWVAESALASWSSNPSAPGDGGNEAGGLTPDAVRVEVTLGQLNPRLKLAACERIEPFLPPNARLWGRGYSGVRCIEGATWTTMLPVTVSVFGPALVANLPMATGTIADPQAFRTEEVDWTRSQGVPVSDPALLAGRALGRPMAPGQVLRAADLRVPQTFSAGDPVRIRLVGHGFTISSEGFAMAGAGEGQSLRVRTAAGKMLVGIVRSRVVEVKL
ncbi:MAG: flagellar basal body P-ring formation chaperone FlgA, partial [Gammaproteobacteria bacterium]